jgi:hypothetical protein
MIISNFVEIKEEVFNFPVWDYSLKDLLRLKNECGTEFLKYRAAKIAVTENKAFATRCRKLYLLIEREIARRVR